MVPEAMAAKAAVVAPVQPVQMAPTAVAVAAQPAAYRPKPQVEPAVAVAVRVRDKAAPVVAAKGLAKVAKARPVGGLCALPVVAVVPVLMRCQKSALIGIWNACSWVPEAVPVRPVAALRTHSIKDPAVRQMAVLTAARKVQTDRPVAELSW